MVSQTENKIGVSKLITKYIIWVITKKKKKIKIFRIKNEMSLEHFEKIGLKIQNYKNPIHSFAVLFRIISISVSYKNISKYVEKKIFLFKCFFTHALVFFSLI